MQSCVRVCDHISSKHRKQISPKCFHSGEEESLSTIRQGRVSFFYFLFIYFFFSKNQWQPTCSLFSSKTASYSSSSSCDSHLPGRYWLCFPCRVSSIENDSKYKRTWGLRGGDGESDSSGSKVVSRQPSGVRNGQAGQMNNSAPSGPYIKRWESWLSPLPEPLLS